MRGTVFFAKNFLIRNTIPPPKDIIPELRPIDRVERQRRRAGALVTCTFHICNESGLSGRRLHVYLGAAPTPKTNDDVGQAKSTRQTGFSPHLRPSDSSNSSQDTHT